MSAKRRQETIARFSIPIESNNSAPSLSQNTAPPLSQGTAPPSSQRSRRVHSTQSVVLDGSIDDDADGDFVLGDEHEGDDDDFIDDEDDDLAPRRTQKGKGKGKAKSKGQKSSGLISAPPSSNLLLDGVNPRVMLISLKAGALGLNLTVANNVYLQVSQTLSIFSY